MAIVTMMPEALRDFDKLPKTIKERFRNLRERLQEWPSVSGAKPLSGKLAGHYRLRTGDYRLRLHVEGETIIIDKIGLRKDIYDD